MGKGVNQRQSAKPIGGGRQGQAAKGNGYPNQMNPKVAGGHTVLGHNGQMLQPAQTQMRVHSGDPRAAVSQGAKGTGGNAKYLQGDG